MALIAGLDNLTMNVSLQHIHSVSSASEYFHAVEPLLYFIIGMVIYSVFIFKFYHFLARRQVLKKPLRPKHTGFEGFMEKIVMSLFFFLENIILIPIMVFFWFTILAILILFLTKTHTPDTVLIISMSIVAAVRITSYYNEDLSRDLAKMIPFALLGIFIVDMSYFNVESTLSIAKQLPQFLDKALYYLILVVIIEFVMSILYKVFHGFKKKDGSEGASAD